MNTIIDIVNIRKRLKLVLSQVLSIYKLIFLNIIIDIVNNRQRLKLILSQVL